MIYKLSNQLFEEIKERQTIYQVAEWLGHDFSKRSPYKHEVLTKLNIQNIHELYALLKTRGYVFDDTIMKWRLKYNENPTS